VVKLLNAHASLECDVTGTLDRVDRVTQFTHFDMSLGGRGTVKSEYSTERTATEKMREGLRRATLPQRDSPTGANSMAAGHSASRCRDRTRLLPEESETHARRTRRKDRRWFLVTQPGGAADRLRCVTIRQVEQVEEHPQPLPRAEVQRLLATHIDDPDVVFALGIHLLDVVRAAGDQARAARHRDRHRTRVVGA